MQKKEAAQENTPAVTSQFVSHNTPSAFPSSPQGRGTPRLFLAQILLDGHLWLRNEQVVM